MEFCFGGSGSAAGATAMLLRLTRLLLAVAASLAAADVAGDLDEAREITSPNLYTRFSSSELRLQSSSLVIDGDVGTSARSGTEVAPWWLVELAAEGSLFAIQSVLVRQGGRDEQPPGTLVVLVSNDTRSQPALADALWMECARGNRSRRAQLFCCSEPVVGRAVAVYASSSEGSGEPLHLNEVTVFGTPKKCPDGFFGFRCERECDYCRPAGRCVCGARSCAAAACGASCAEDTRRRLETCNSPAGPAGQLAIIPDVRGGGAGGGQGDRDAARLPGRCGVYGYDLSKKNEYLRVLHAAVELPAGVRDASLLIGNDSRAPAYGGSPHWSACNSFGSLPRGSNLLSCEAPMVGRHAALRFEKGERDGLSYEVLAAALLFGSVVESERLNGTESSVDLNFMGYYWMDDRQYATYMLLAFPALFAVAMMAATFAIACIRRKKVVSEDAYFVDDLPPLLRGS